MSPPWLVQELSDYFAFGHLTLLSQTMASQSPPSTVAWELQYVCHLGDAFLG